MRRLLLTAVVAGLAILFWLGRERVDKQAVLPQPDVAENAQPIAPLPPMPLTGAPLMATQPALLARARQGDRAASARLVSELHQCVQAREFADIFGTNTLDAWMAAHLPPRGWGDEDFAHIRVSVARNMDYVEQRKALCVGTHGMLDTSGIFEAWQIAARLGDDDATACLLDPLLPSLPPDMSDADRTAYYTEAMQLAQRGLAHGNWHVANALELVYEGEVSRTGLVSLYDPRQDLRMVWLMRLGLSDDNPRVEVIDAIIKARMEQMTAEEASAAERDARQLFERSFRDVTPPPATEAACVAPGLGPA